MSEVIARPATGTTKEPKHSKKTPSPDPIKPVQNEGDTLAIEAAQVLLGITFCALYNDENKPRELGNQPLERARELLDLLRYPDDHERHPLDPARGDIHEHLAHISSELENALEDMLGAILPDYAPSDHAVFTALIECAYNFAERLFIAYSGLPATLEDLRALTTEAGAKPLRDRPQPPIQRAVDTPVLNAGYRHRAMDVQRVFENLLTQCESLRDYSVDIRARLQSNGSTVEACNDLTIVQHMVAFMGSICEEMSGPGDFIGGPASWATMDGIEPIGGAA